MPACFQTAELGQTFWLTIVTLTAVSETAYVTLWYTKGYTVWGDESRQDSAEKEA